MKYIEAMKIEKEMDRVKKIKCKHDDVQHVHELEYGHHIFECRDCGEYVAVEELDSPYDWDNSSVVPKYLYKEYDLNSES